MFGRLAQLIHSRPRDHITTHAAVMVMAGSLASVFTYLYQVVMANLLSPEQFGFLSSLLALLVILSVFSPTIQLSAAKFAANAEPGHLRLLWVHILKRASLLGLAVTILSFLLIPFYSWLLHTEAIGVLVILSLSFLFAFMLPVNLGIIQGLQRFTALGAANMATPLFRLGLGALLVGLGLGIKGAFLPLLGGFVVVFVATLLPLRTLPGSKGKLGRISLGSYFGWTSFAFGSFIVLANVDVVLARHYLDPQAAGEYALIAVLGRIVLFAPAGIILMMFPKIAKTEQTEGHRLAVLAASASYTAVAAGTVVAIYGLFPGFVVNIFFSSEYDAAIPFLFRYGLGMMGISMLYLMMHYHLAVGHTRVGYVIFATMLLQFVLLGAFHSDTSRLVDLRLVTSMSGLIAMLVYGAVGNRKLPPQLNNSAHKAQGATTDHRV